ncbi:MAG: hypothetical protein HQL24_08275 [Candidatus Omnitrophica bacterium]|nr:hypothetical protein [Candidatus Omnitrophota bacterium]
MNGLTEQKLLQDKRVREEIDRHRWIESEKAGYDIGYDLAAADWLQRFSKSWMTYHMPKRKLSTKLTSTIKQIFSSF